ncbi:hypothetical protein F511_22297 [Dorcoceras hygrometricum]|uniref:Uncharacterized protein n=1 Tax=Dorcoceras hygrometricum TaxID=472368 RepID=A0A2Z7D9D1_9LAMI|nr:hypothetical protein F511_22297 [Dorcoceras hygrometricum]
MKIQQRVSTSSWYLELAFAKRCRLNKLERQRFAFAISRRSKARKMKRRRVENQQMAFSRWLSADEEKREKLKRRRIEIQQMD